MVGKEAHGERENASLYNGGLGAEPPAGCGGRAPGQGVRGLLKAFEHLGVKGKFTNFSVFCKFSSTDEC